MESATDSSDELIGKRLAHFRVVEQIGRGGMGVVYRAEDDKLRRAVALKVLSRDLVSDEERRARFLREARSAAALTHPNIATIYEIGDVDGVVFIAMELVEGRSLREVLAEDGCLSADRAAAIATGVARALVRAHGAGVIHRDLKPDNVMVSSEDEVKLLDFGLAKLFVSTADEEATADDLAVQDTVSHVSTRDGRILGTPAYMSPEQGTGADVDHRADLFSFGTMLYEMISGKRPFEGKTPMATIVALSRDEPARLSTLTPTTPLELERIVHRCLEKSPDDRYRDARALLDDLRKLSRDTLSMDSLPARDLSAPDPPRGGFALAAGVLVVLGLGLWAVAAYFGSEVTDDEPAADAELAVPVPEPVTYVERELTAMPSENGVDAAVVVGDRLFYQDQRGIWVRDLDGTTPSAVSLPEGMDAALNDVFPRGEHLLLGPKRLLGSLFVLELATGETRELRSNALEGRVAPDGNTVAYIERDGVYSIHLDGSDRRRLSSRAPGDAIWSLTWSPDSRFVAFVRRRASEDGANATIETISMDGAHLERVLENRRLMQPQMAIAWPEQDRMLYALAVPASSGGCTELWEMRLDDGVAAQEPHRPVHAFEQHRVMGMRAVGDTLSFLKLRVQSDVHVATLGSDGRTLETPRRLTLDDADDLPDGWLSDDRVLFSSNRGGNWDVFAQRVDAPTAELILGGEAWETWPQRRGAESIWAWRLDVDDEGDAAGAMIVSSSTTGSDVTTVATIEIESAVTLRGRPAPRAAIFRCTSEDPATCVLSRSVAGELRFHRLDADGGLEEPPFARIERPQALYEWALSPDGTQIALVKMHYYVTMLGLDGRSPRELELDGRGKLQHVAWAPGGDGLYYSALQWGDHNHALVYSDLEGRSTVLYGTEHAWLGQPVPSPDGGDLAFAQREFDADVWLLEPGG